MIYNLLLELNACDEAIEWASGKSWKEIFDTCHRGDWLLWLYKKTNQGDLKKFTLAKAHCANTVRHLMQDKRSIDAVDVAIRFGNGEANMAELNAAAASSAAYASAAYAADAYASAAYAYSYAADAAAAAASADTYAYAAASAASAADAYASAAYAYSYAAAAASAAARKENQLLTANICRQYLPFEIWNIKED